MAATVPSRPRLSAALREEARVTPLELFFDLVFVLALTQCTALMADQPTWEGLAKGILVLAVMWWAWVGYAWLTSVIDPEEGAVRLVIFAAMAGLLIVALCVPGAFAGDALLFAGAYGVVRVAHLALFYLACRDDDELRRAVTTGLSVSTAVAIGLLVIASFLDGVPQGAVWALALAIDMSGPLFHGQDGWRLVPE
ncbi:MAG TPA: low temperature requirement protein A, partial [Solirubrobacteraceae bacterium]|nr:low temperature requirement protein A [Solirubrobacteraceae bacterium]